MKHIAIPYYFFRTKVEVLERTIIMVSTNDQLADHSTKELLEGKFVKARKKLWDGNDNKVEESQSVKNKLDYHAWEDKVNIDPFYLIVYVTLCTTL